MAALSEMSLANRASEFLTVSTSLIKIIITYSQVLSSLMRIPDIHWPHDFVQFMKTFDRIFSIELFTLLPADCVAGTRVGYYFELLASLLLPIGVLIVLFILIASRRRLALRYNWWVESGGSQTPGCRGDLHALSRPRVYKLLTWFFLLIYPTLARKPSRCLTALRRRASSCGFYATTRLCSAMEGVARVGSCRRRGVCRVRDWGARCRLCAGMEWAR